MTVASQVKQCLSNVKSIEAGLSTLAINAQDEDEKKLLHEHMMQMNDIKGDLLDRVGKLELEEHQYKGF